MRITSKMHFSIPFIHLIYGSKNFPILHSYFSQCPSLESANPEYIEKVVNLYLDNAGTDEHMLEAEAFLEAAEEFERDAELFEFSADPYDAMI